MERTLLLIKPDALQRKLVGEIIQRIERKGLQLIGLKMMVLDRELLSEHYRHLADKPFFADIANFMQSSPTIACCVRGLDAIETVRRICGITKAREATPGTIRGDLAMSIQANLVHASDSPTAAAEELRRFFGEGEICEYQETLLDSVYAPGERKST